MITITTDTDGRVIRIGYQDMALPKGAIEVDAIPSEPTIDEGKACELYYENGALVWRIVDAPPPPEPEPIPEPTPPTKEEISALRASAYRDRVDPITCEINRLRDMGGTEEDIADAMARRDAEVARIKAEFPYTSEL